MGNRKSNRLELLGKLAFGAISLCVMFLMFWHLGAPSVNATDEAYHGVNAYEMLKADNWLVNTYRYETDYFNSKPPLNLWLIQIAYRLFGISSFSLRLPAAVAGTMTYFIIAVYLWKRKNIFTCDLFGLAFMTNVLPFTYHMFRAGDMDSVYCLFSAVAVLALEECRKHPNAILMYGFATGLAFLTKGVHAGTILVIGVVCLPVIWHSLSWRKMLGSIVLLITPVLAWAVPRFFYDGFAFFNRGVVGEMSDKVVVDHVGDVTYPLRKMLLQKNWQLLLACISIAIAVWIVSIVKYSRAKTGEGGGRGEKARRMLRQFTEDYAILLAAILIPIVLYMAVQAQSEWYYYSGYLFGNVATAILMNDILYRLHGKKWMVSCLAIGYTCACLIVFSHIIHIIYVSDISGDPNVILRECIASSKEDWGTAYCDIKAYIQNENNSYKPSDQWQCDNVFYAETIMDWRCIDGGVEGFLNDTDSNVHVLVLSSSLWDYYSAELTGYVILQDNGYLIMSSERY